MSLSRPLPFRTISYRAAALALALATVAACGDDPSPVAPPEPVDIVLSDTSITLIRSVAVPTPSKQVTADVVGSDNEGVVWKVGDASVATVSQTGLVTAVSEGNTFVTATSVADPTKNRSVVVNVVSTVVRVTPPDAFTWVTGPTRQLTAIVENNADKRVTWRSTNTAVATVSATGVVTAVGAGTTNIIAQSVADPSKEAFSAVTIDAAPSSSFTRLTSGTAITGLSASTDEFAVYGYIEVPVGATSLVIELTGPNGDADLYVRRGGPGITPSACVSAAASSNEKCTITNPQSRIYYVLIHAYEAYTNLTLKATVTQ